MVWVRNERCANAEDHRRMDFTVSKGYIIGDGRTS